MQATMSLFLAFVLVLSGWRTWQAHRTDWSRLDVGVY
jgi:hypothetical protein